MYKSTNEKTVQKWDHNGFLMLYPEGEKASSNINSGEFTEPPNEKAQVSTNIDNLEKWDHAGYNILYNSNIKKVSKKLINKKSHKK